MILILFLLIICNTNTENPLHSIIQLNPFNETYFNLNNQFLIFEYKSIVDKRVIDGETFFIFDKGNKPSTEIYIYNSYDKIEKDDFGFINYDYKISLKDKKYFKIYYNDTIFTDKTKYYIVLYDISTVYEDSIYVSNNLLFNPLNNSISYKHKLDFEMHFYFRIYTEKELYFHYQARQISGILFNDAYYFLVKDENDEIYSNGQCSGINKYIKIKPFFNYYIEILVIKNPYFEDISQFKLSFSKYGEKYWMQDGKTIKVDILKSQYLLFFKNISNFEINEPIFFKGHMDYSEYAQGYFYIKYYDSDDFEKLKDNFPSDKNKFDKAIGYLKNGGDFQFNIEKNNYYSQKGILLGVFIENEYLNGIEPTSLYINVTNKEENSEEEKYNEEEEENNKENEKDNEEEKDEESHKEDKDDKEDKKEKDDKSKEKDKDKDDTNIEKKEYYTININVFIYIGIGGITIIFITIICRCYCCSSKIIKNGLVNINVETILINNENQSNKLSSSKG